MFPKTTAPAVERARREPTPATGVTAPLRPSLPPAGGRVLQNRRAPAQLSLFQRALPTR